MHALLKRSSTNAQHTDTSTQQPSHPRHTQSEIKTFFSPSPSSSRPERPRGSGGKQNNNTQEKSAEFRLGFSGSHGRKGEQTRERTSENLPLHLCCDVSSPLTLPYLPLSVVVCARGCVCVRASAGRGGAHAHTSTGGSV